MPAWVGFARQFIATGQKEFLARAAQTCADPAVRLGEPTVPFGQIRRDGKSGPVQLVDQEIVPARETFRESSAVVCQIDCLLDKPAGSRT